MLGRSWLERRPPACSGEVALLFDWCAVDSTQVASGAGIPELLAGFFFLLSLLAYMTGCPKGGAVSPVWLAASLVAGVCAAASSLQGFAVFPCLVLYDAVIARASEIAAAKDAPSGSSGAANGLNGHARSKGGSPEGDAPVKEKKRFHMYAYAKGPATPLQRVEAAFRTVSPATAVLLRSSIVVAVAAWLAAVHLGATEVSRADLPHRPAAVVPSANPAAFIAAEAPVPAALTGAYATALHLAWLVYPVSQALDWCGAAVVGRALVSTLLLLTTGFVLWLSPRSFASVPIIEGIFDLRNVGTLIVFAGVVAVVCTWVKLAVFGRTSLGGRTPEK